MRQQRTVLDRSRLNEFLRSEPRMRFSVRPLSADFTGVEFPDGDMPEYLDREDRGWNSPNRSETSDKPLHTEVYIPSDGSARLMTGAEELNEPDIYVEHSRSGGTLVSYFHFGPNNDPCLRVEISKTNCRVQIDRSVCTLIGPERDGITTAFDLMNE